MIAAAILTVLARKGTAVLASFFQLSCYNILIMLPSEEHVSSKGNFSHDESSSNLASGDNISAEVKEEEEQYSEREYYQNSLKDGYRGLAGAICGLIVSELILVLGKVTGDPPLIFALIAVVFATRHLLQIRQAKQQLRQYPD
jgi:hypothetical protein